jgi:CheY-like chemotaxis protein
VLVDIMMPLMDGYETMHGMRELPLAEHLAIIALTAKTGSGERERCIGAGATGYISKPVENGPSFLHELSACLAEAEPEPETTGSDVLR